MKKVCAWCTGEILKGSGKEGDVISHGICESCRNYFFSPMGPPSFDGFLDMLSVPVIVVDERVRVVAANRMACDMLGKGFEDLRSNCLGDAIECAYSRLPEGCGRSVHCRSCAVRLTVLDTFMSGRSHYDVPAYHDLSFDKMDRKVCFLISTEKCGDFIYLKVQEITPRECDNGGTL